MAIVPELADVVKPMRLSKCQPIVNHPDPIIAETVARLQQFRQNLYNFFPHRADAVMELIDALASNTSARSVVELSLSPLFRREYSSVYDAIEHFFVPSQPEKAAQERREHEQALLGLIVPFLPPRSSAGFGCLGRM